MKRLLVALFSLLALGGGAARPTPAGKVQLPCGLPEQQPLWVDFADGSVPFWSTVFARPGVVGAASNFIVPPQLRAAGAKTVYFDLYLSKRVGTPSQPADPAVIQERADKLFDTAAGSSGCDHPLVALNELFGAGVPTPWTATTTAYRANVLAFLQRLSDRGARPFLLLSSSPYTGGEAADWWRQAAQVADLVPEVYFNGRVLSQLGPTRAARRLRSTMRNRVAELTALGVPPSRIGVMLTFSSTPNAGGREGLKPLAKWLEVVQWEALAARQVAAETGIASIWSWGWATWTAAGNDPDKAAAACVYLWTRDHSLCDAPKLVGPSFDASTAAGAALPRGALCALDLLPLRATALAALARVTGDRELAFSALLQRLVLAEAADVRAADVIAAERDVVADRFGGSRARYVAALARAGATVDLGRAVLGDELRRARVEAGLTVPAPTGAQIDDYYATYGDEPARFVRSDEPLAFLGGLKEGVALSATAPGRLFGLAPAGRTRLGDATVTAVGEAAPLGSFPLVRARGAIRAALVRLAREDAFEAWSVRRQTGALDRLECAQDRLPQPAAVDLTDWLPFLALA